jgi:uncharacterized membrane protein YraQ (UPF0718 family)
MNPQLLVITWGGLGPQMACGRVVAVLLFGLLFGAVLLFLPRSWSVLPVLAGENRPKRRREFALSDFLRRCWRTLEFVGFYVLLGVLLGSIVEVLVPGRWIFAIFGSGGWAQILLASMLGVPLYACGGGTIPLVSSFLDQGMAPGAALAFLVAGPATRIAPLMALGTILRPLVVVAYVAVLVLFAAGAGILYGLI